MKQKRLSIKDIEKIHNTKYVGTHQINGITIDHFGKDSKHNIIFDIFDGIAYCADYRGEEIILSYPKLDFLKEAKSMRDSIIKNLNLNEDDEITPLNVVATYHQVFVNR